MRLVAEYRDVKGNATNITKVVNLRAKQTHFTAALVNADTDDIINLDVQYSILKTSLRELIMNIKHGVALSLIYSMESIGRGGAIKLSSVLFHLTQIK